MLLKLNAMHDNRMLGNLCCDILIIAGFVFILIAPFASLKDRPFWAKALMVAAALVGILFHAIDFALDRHWLTLGRSARGEFSYLFTLAAGLLVGWLTALVFSGQVCKKKTVQVEKT